MGKKAKTKRLPPDLELIRLEMQAHEWSVPRGLVRDETDVLNEIGYALKPVVHERRIPPYGCIICPGRFAHKGATLVTSVSPSVSAEFIRIAADGRRSFVVLAEGTEPELWELEDACDTERDLLRLARGNRGLAIKRIESGLVTLIHDGWVFSVRGREWLVRRPMEEMADAVRQVAPGIRHVDAILELCCYVLSPKNLGTTFVYFLQEPDAVEIAAWEGKPEISSLNLDVDSPSDYHGIVHLTRHHDGAFLVGPDGRLRSLGAHLVYDQKTAELIQPQGGTRHTSAKRYSYEHDSAVVFVVSEDGRVSAFSDGARVADSPILASREAQFLRRIVPGNADAVDTSLVTTTCPRCGKGMAIQVVIVAGWKEHEDVSCPICGQPDVYSAMCWSLKATPMK